MIARGLVLFLLVFGGVSQAQEATPAAIEELYFEALTTAEGLPSQTIHNTFQDKEGYMWISTEEAVVRYDGYEFRPFYENPKTGVNL